MLQPRIGLDLLLSAGVQGAASLRVAEAFRQIDRGFVAGALALLALPKCAAQGVGSLDSRLRRVQQILDCHNEHVFSRGRLGHVSELRPKDHASKCPF
ncbi:MULTISPECIES: hypothetical protein [unclassified Sphingomonas]|uniref:hypothetical protein n=1 Tax=unclassified Sphingomonas TaxID=196159 RepID=UPI000AE8FE3D|nr:MULTISPECIES: hypothetical protein [unclassified Sphingomonas]